jgi:hypothetical protein
LPVSTDAPTHQRIALLDSGLSRRMGHHAHFGHGLAQLCAEQGIPLVTLARKHVEAKLMADLANAKAVFARSLYEVFAQGDIFDQDWNDYRTGRRLYAEDLDQSGLEPQGSDLFWMPTARPREIAGFADWLLKHDVRPQVVIGFHLLMRPMEPGSVEGLVHRLATNRLIEAVGRERIFPYTTNLPLARRLAAAMRLGIYLAPLPHFYGLPAAPVAPPPLPPGDGPLIASIGVPQARKLGVPLPDIVHGALRRRPDLRFVIQVNEAESNADLMALEKLRQVKLVKGWLDDDAFVALIQAAAALLLPYQRDRYAENISGPFAFAAAYGRPAIVPSGTWMAERIARKQAAGVAYKRDEAVIDAIAVALDRQAQLHAQAGKLAEQWRVWDGKALLRVVRQWAAGDGTGELRCVIPTPPPPVPPVDAS